MLNMQEWMGLVDYKITEGSEYCWSCYGPNAYRLHSWNGVHGKGGYSAEIIFSTKSQKVYEVTVCDFTNDRAYRMINPKNVEKHRKEAETRGTNLNEAWDDVDFVDLEVDEDFVEKCSAIFAGEDYSTDILVPIDLPDDVLLRASLEAHKQNITLNAYINAALRELVGKVDQGDYSDPHEITVNEITFDKTHFHLHKEMQEWCNESIGQGGWAGDGFTEVGDLWSIDNRFGNITFKFINKEDLNQFKMRWENQNE